MEVPVVHLLMDRQIDRDSIGRALIAAGFRVLASASVHEFFGNYIYDTPGCVVLGLAMPEKNDELRSELTNRGYAPQLVCIEESLDAARSVYATNCGTIDFLPKPVRMASTLAAVEKAIARDAKVHAIERARRRLQALPALEREVFYRLLEGKRNIAIAGDLGISIKEANAHRQRLMRRLGFRLVTQLIQFAIEADVLPAAMPARGPDSRKGGGRRVSRVRSAGGCASHGNHRRSGKDLEKRLLAAAIHELNALLAARACDEDADTRAAAQLARALNDSALSVLQARRIDVAAAFNSLDGLGHTLGDERLQQIRRSVVGGNRRS